MNCVICGEPIIGYGNNPEPVKRWEDGRCCDVCDQVVVIPTRIISRLRQSKNMREVLPPPKPEDVLYQITPEEGGASDIEAMWLAEDERNES